MPLVAHSPLPSFARLRREGQEILDPGKGPQREARELHIGLLNMMPDAALEATERQFMRLLGACSRDARVFLHPFTIDGIERGAAARAHLDRHYEAFGQLQRDGLHALIITGANITEADITRERFFEPLAEVTGWAWRHVCSVLCSCLAAHAVWKRYHGIDRTHLAEKRWGVFSHRRADRTHPLVRDVNTRFDTPHSRFNDVPREQIEAAGMHVLVESERAGVLLAVSRDRLRYIYFQGHPEYDTRSLLKEYKREVYRFAGGERPDHPPYPEGYFAPPAVAILEPYKRAVRAARTRGAPPPEFPEAEVEPYLDNTWTDTGKALFNNWLGLVYELAARDRAGLFRPGVDPDDPLRLRPLAAAGLDRAVS